MLGDFLLRTFFDGDGITIRCAAVHAAAGGADVEGNAVGAGHQGKVVSAHLVGHIAVGRHAVAPHEHGIDLLAAHQKTAGTVDDHGARHTKTSQFPGRQGCSLEAGPCFIQPGVANHTPGMASSDHPQCGSNPCRGNRAGMAVMEDATP